jgi:hypothetical protein
VVACTDPAGAKRILEAHGYKNIQITGHNFFVGSEGNLYSDWYHTGFTAQATNGTQVTGTVTKGLLFKENTIRLDFDY